jgi:hypothetical protein
MIAFGVYALSVENSFDKNYWFGALVFFSIGAMLFFFAARGMVTHRPISIGGTGVSSWFLGVPIRHLEWSDISKIERYRYTDIQQSVTRYKFIIYGSKVQIRFDDRLKNLRSALGTLTEFSQLNGIELIEIDIGLDTRRRMLETVSDAAQRKSILREGIKTRIRNL